MKRLLSIIIMTTIIVILGGCGSTKDQQNNISQSTSNQTVQTKEAENTKDTNVATSENKGATQESTTNKSNSKSLIVYFSRVGNTNFSNNVDVVSSASLNAASNGLVGNAEINAQVKLHKLFFNITLLGNFFDFIKLCVS